MQAGLEAVAGKQAPGLSVTSPAVLAQWQAWVEQSRQRRHHLLLFFTKKKNYYRQLLGFISCLEAVPRALGLLAYCQTNRVTPGLLVGALLRHARLGGL